MGRKSKNNASRLRNLKAVCPKPVKAAVVDDSNESDDEYLPLLEDPQLRAEGYCYDRFGVCHACP
jgi:hypothetical protein